MKHFNAVQFQHFGEQIKIKTATRALFFDAIIEPDSDNVNLGETRISFSSIVIYIDEDAFKNKGVERRTQLIRNNTTYTINEIGNDGFGMATLRATRS